MSSVATLQRDAGSALSEVPNLNALSSVVHDLRQPLSSIEAIAYYLTLVLPQADQKIQAQLERIRELVQESNEILSSSVRVAGSAPLSSQAANPVEGA